MSVPPGDGNDLLRNEANAWVARFAPLVMQNDVALTPEEVRQRLATLQTLAQEGPSLRNRMAGMFSAKDSALRDTVARAVQGLPSIETDLKQRLGRIAPGDPHGTVNLAALNERLNEREARAELGSSVIPDALDLLTGAGNPLAAVPLLLFAFVWLSFTTFHAVMMIGGMMRTVGPIALALLGFYAIFYGAGFLILASAFAVASSERVGLVGHDLTVTRSCAGIVRTKHFRLGPGSRAEVAVPQMSLRQQNNYNRIPTPCIQMADVDGRLFNFGANCAEYQKRDAVDKINAYLAVATTP